MKKVSVDIKLHNCMKCPYRESYYRGAPKGKAKRIDVCNKEDKIIAKTSARKAVPQIPGWCKLEDV